jgi:hypothetical protein
MTRKVMARPMVATRRYGSDFFSIIITDAVGHLAGFTAIPSF